jgi:hypothetical protein
MVNYGIPKNPTSSPTRRSKSIAGIRSEIRKGDRHFRFSLKTAAPTWVARILAPSLGLVAAKEPLTMVILIPAALSELCRSERVVRCFQVLKS